MSDDATGKLPVAELESDSLQLSDLPPKPLNSQQKKFLKNYLEKSMSAGAAYEDAYGCKSEWARTMASRLLSTNANIIAAVEEYGELEKRAASLTLMRKQNRAAQVLGEALDGDDVNAQIRAAKDILDRTGHKPKEEIDLTSRTDMNIKLALPEDLNIDSII